MQLLDKSIQTITPSVEIRMSKESVVSLEKRRSTLGEISITSVIMYTNKERQNFLKK